ncbi:unnamed protein product [Caretta caretta]
MDVTHVPQFRPYLFLHVSVDIYLSFFWASPQRGEATNKVIHHLQACLFVMGRPCQIKTDMPQPTALQPSPPFVPAGTSVLHTESLIISRAKPLLNVPIAHSKPC